MLEKGGFLPNYESTLISLGRLCAYGQHRGCEATLDFPVSSMLQTSTSTVFGTVYDEKP